jgi:conjugative relaxase-like TrwC/TraI family protein
VINGATLTPARARYLADQVATSREDYYAGHGESEGRWFGEAARTLGLEGAVQAGQLEPLLDGIHPITGKRLRRVVATRHITIPIPHPETGEPSSFTRELKPVGGFDFVLSAPKSISAAHALAQPATAREILAAHLAAVDAALTLLEHEAAYTRSGRNGLNREPARGIAAALYTHRLSRNLDPQLHTHCAIANLAQGQTSDDDKWRTLDSQTLLRRWKLTLGYAYRAHLRHEIQQRLGWHFTPPHRGLSELASWHPEALRSLSTRRQHIEAHLATLGSDTWNASQIAALATRAQKPKDIHLDQLHDTWRERITRHGMTPEKLQQALEPQPPTAPKLDPAGLCELLVGPHGLTERHTTFTRPEAMRAIAEAARQGLPSHELQRLTDKLLEHRDAIRVDDERYTTRDLLTHEATLLELAARGRDAAVAVLAHPILSDALARAPHMTAEQRAVIASVTTSGHAIENIEALAGAGKTTTAAVIANAYRAAGYRVIGAAPTARAARELDHAGIPAHTINRILHHPDQHLSHGEPIVAIIDEAGMAGTRDLAQLTTLLREHNAKIIQIGDSKQLAGVPAGGAFTALSARHDPARLRAGLRQRDPEELRALDAIRHSSPADYIAHKIRREELDITPDPVELRRRVADWWNTNRHAYGAENILVITRRSATAAALNQHIRAARLLTGQLQGNAITAAGSDYAIGDRIITRRNHPHLGLDNGTRGTITQIDPAKRSITLRADDARTLDIPAHYLDAGHVHHGYAQTAHLAQGLTAETALVVTTPDEHAAEWTYSAASRVRGATRHLVLALEPDRQREPGDTRTLESAHAIAVLAEAMHRQQSEDIATSLSTASDPEALPSR